VTLQYTYPHTIDSGHGERITWLRRLPGTLGDRLEVENEVQPGVGPPMHVHHYLTEALTVVEGRIGWARPGREPGFAGPGATVTFTAGDPHRFWNAGEGVLRCRGWVEPADNIEFILGAVFASQRAAKSGRPDPWDAAFLMRRYRSEMAMVEIPAFVQRVVLPVQVVVGRVLGKYGKYADAPEAVKR
jgi:uncharacterized cupin superfamily protein